MMAVTCKACLTAGGLYVSWSLVIVHLAHQLTLRQQRLLALAERRPQRKVRQQGENARAERECKERRGWHLPRYAAWESASVFASLLNHDMFENMLPKYVQHRCVLTLLLDLPAGSSSAA